MLTKIANRLFYDAYQYKIVLVCKLAQNFRKPKLEKLLNSDTPPGPYTKNIKDEIYAISLKNQLKGMSDYDVRVEYPWINIYSNCKTDIDNIANIDPGSVKCIFIPPVDTILSEGSVIMPNTPFDFRVTLGKIHQENSAFLDWAVNNSNIKLTNRCIQALSSNKSRAGSYFYVLGDRTLLMTKIHIGGAITRIERIIKAS